MNMWFYLFLFSIVINVLCFFYIRWLLKTVKVINEDIFSVSDLIEEFRLHLSSLYEMEVFYGDETLRALLQHASELTDRLENLDLVLNEELKNDMDLNEEEENKE